MQIHLYKETKSKPAASFRSLFLHSHVEMHCLQMDYFLAHQIWKIGCPPSDTSCKTLHVQRRALYIHFPLFSLHFSHNLVTSYELLSEK